MIVTHLTFIFSNQVLPSTTSKCCSSFTNALCRAVFEPTLMGTLPMVFNPV